MKRLVPILIVAALVIAGCGSIDWFPVYKRLPTTPDAFSFATKTGVPTFATISSAAITVSGLTATSSPVSVSDSTTGADSQYAINGATPTATAGSVQNGDSVKVFHTSSNNLGTTATSKLIIGDRSATFSSVTQTVQKQDFKSTAVAAGSTGYSGLIPLQLISGTHTISISSSNGYDPRYALDSDTGTYTNATQTIYLYNGESIYMRVTVPSGTTSGTNVVATLSIDGVPITLTVPVL